MSAYANLSRIGPFNGGTRVQDGLDDDAITCLERDALSLQTNDDIYYMLSDQYIGVGRDVNCRVGKKKDEIVRVTCLPCP